MIMKKYHTIFSVLTIMFVLAPLFQSCSDSNDKYFLAIATHKISEKSDSYFVLSNGETMYASNQTTSKLDDGQRVYVYFEILDEKVNGYDYIINIRDLQEILTKSPFVMTEETADSIGDDNINITGLWFSDGYLNVQFQFLGVHSSSKRHMVNLVYNETGETETNTEDGYTNVEFRHNAFNNPPNEVLNGIVSFKGPFEKEGVNGLIVRYNSIYDKVKYLKINFSENSATIFSSPDNSYHYLIE